MKRVINILLEKGPLLSGDLAQRLVDRYRVSSVAARQIISRSSEPVRKLFALTFDNNQKYIYLDSHFASQDFYEGIIASLNKASKAYYAFVHPFIFQQGFIHKKQLAAYTFSPLKPLKGHKIAESIINDLLSAKIILEYNDDCYQLNDGFDGGNYSRFRAIEIAKKITLEHFNDWARNINLIAYNSSKQLGPSAEFYKFQWSFTAPSYVGAGAKVDKKPTSFIVADILLGEQVKEADIDYFIKKLRIIRQGKKVSPFIPVLITDGGIEDKAFKILKSEGVMLGFVDKLFGSTYSELLKSLVNVIENAAAVISKNPEKFIQVMDNLTILEGKTYNLRGDLFELAVGYYYYPIARFFEVNKFIRDPKSGKRKEIDVFVKCSHNEIKVVECKGYRYPVELDYVNEWLTEKVPTIRSWLLSQDEFSKKDITFEIWSTGGFTEEAERVLEKMSKNTKKYTIRYFGSKEILEKSQRHEDENLRKILQKYYLSDFK